MRSIVGVKLNDMNEYACNGGPDGNPLISNSPRILPNCAITFFLDKNGRSHSPLINTGDARRDGVTFFLRSVRDETPTAEKPAASIKISPSLMLRLSFCDSNPRGFGETPLSSSRCRRGLSRERVSARGKRKIKNKKKREKTEKEKKEKR